jgi:hypothetical protein
MANRTIEVIRRGLTGAAGSAGVLGHEEISASEDVTASQRGKLLQVSSAAVTLTVDAAADVTSGFYCYILGDGHNVTVARSASDTINGATSITVLDGQMAILATDGISKFWTLDSVSLLDEDDMTSDSAAHAASQQSVKAYVDGRTSKFVSSAQTITSAGTLAVAHGLAAVPDFAFMSIVCTDAGGDNGYAQNDEVVIGATGAGHTVHGAAVWLDSTNINIRFTNDSNVFHIPNKGTGVPADLDNTKWGLYLTALVIA